MKVVRVTNTKVDGIEGRTRREIQVYFQIHEVSTSQLHIFSSVYALKYILITFLLPIIHPANLCPKPLSNWTELPDLFPFYIIFNDEESDTGLATSLTIYLPGNRRYRI